LIEELELQRPVIAGYDIGSRIAQTIAREHPDVAGALVISPPLPGAGERALSPNAQRKFWYQAFHRLEDPEAIAQAIFDVSST
jgi:pimeloyl-ACP methyl ester carboxylesterase